ncbi:DeoR/GlpR family DNA-binding transcription regulator [Enterococcus villorum]|uniref:DeoR family transcriptional regulator n=2 Tax=Enterococcus villorum TaxID=112904 RepID=A0A511J4M5_9ENTE|nr:DeoR/GlpR family DNA-binding transcription regulator [Enterococcus villorum]EOH86383.1 hypothetical protein UAO_02496 [Enterococcus villorum ATCC 700913]EOW78813.1 hypothetical protein I591_00356 [Enterococcus villorum ATCC 700913]GEL92934.1 DeoR family transcriptional regulator [Enterococcus villorum]
MLMEVRLKKIKQIINEQQHATMDELAEQLNVSKDTIRRDLIKLEEQHIIRRTHGGAVLVEKEASIFDYDQRSTKLHQVKTQLGKIAESKIKTNSSVIFDSSTTVEKVIQYLFNKRITAITNSLIHATLLAKMKEVTISVLPGKLHKTQLFLHGADTIEKLKQYHVDYTLLGVFALSNEGVFIHTEEEGLVKRQMIKQANTVIAIADHTKMGKTGFFKICDLSEIDLLITDLMPNPSLKQALIENHVACLILDKIKE